MRRCQHFTWRGSARTIATTNVYLCIRLALERSLAILGASVRIQILHQLRHCFFLFQISICRFVGLASRHLDAYMYSSGFPKVLEPDGGAYVCEQNDEHVLVLIRAA